MAQLINIDAALLQRAHENFWLDLDDVSAGQGLNGQEQVVFTENRRWVGQLNFLRTDFSGHMHARVIGDRLRGRANILRVGLCNRGTIRFLGDAVKFYASAGLSDADVQRGHVLFDDAAPFGDGSGFALPDSGEPVASDAAFAGASVIRLDGYIGRNIAVGAFFSIDDFLYRVEENTDGLVVFNPPLRRAVSAGAQVNVSRPKVQVRLQDKADWRPFCEYFRNGQPMTVNVIEAFDR